MHEHVAIFAVDPGTTTGIARGIFPAVTDSVWAGLQAGKWETWEVEGEPKRQAWEIMSEYAEWVGAPTFRKLAELSIRRFKFVVEDFVVRVGEGAASKRELLDPVRVGSGIDSLSLNREGLVWQVITYQQPSQAMNFATDERLKRHKLWVKGSTHRRDAMRHLALAYSGVASSTTPRLNKR